MTPAEQLRERIRAEIEAATGEGLNVNDPLPDQLIANAQEHRIPMHAVIAWIHDSPRPTWTAAELVSWSERWGFITAPADRPEAAQ